MICAKISIIKNQFGKLCGVLDFHEHINPLEKIMKSVVQRPDILTFKPLDSLFETDTRENKKPLEPDILQKVFGKIKTRRFSPLSQMPKHAVLQ